MENGVNLSSMIICHALSKIRYRLWRILMSMSMDGTFFKRLFVNIEEGTFIGNSHSLRPKGMLLYTSK